MFHFHVGYLDQDVTLQTSAYADLIVRVHVGHHDQGATLETTLCLDQMVHFYVDHHAQDATLEQMRAQIRWPTFMLAIMTRM